jgi:hypothetical protein
VTKARLLEKLDAEVERWNRDHPVGTQVRYRFAPNASVIAPTASAAFIHQSSACVFLAPSCEVPLQSLSIS